MNPTKVALLGYGRFGKAFAELINAATPEGPIGTSPGGKSSSSPKMTVAAYDPFAEIPPAQRVDSIEHLARDASYLIVAVPVARVAEAIEPLEAVLAQMHPGERPAETAPVVIDVGSVKRGPVAAMRRILGDRFPWVATHPLFGPSSIVLGEKPLRVVICPNDLHPDATLKARNFYSSLGCHVIEQSADEHDRIMADTHALAFFLAKGLLDVGTDEGRRFSPPSFQAIARTVEAVRSDAGHLFLAIQNENPYASAARARLLGALDRIHQDLEEEASTPAAAAPASPSEESKRKLAHQSLEIPDLGERAFELRETRELIDEVDQELVRLLARRAELSRRAGHLKLAEKRAVQDPAREQALFESRRSWAIDLNLDPSWIQEIFERILTYSRSIQQPGPGEDSLTTRPPPPT